MSNPMRRKKTAFRRAVTVPATLAASLGLLAGGFGTLNARRAEAQALRELTIFKGDTRQMSGITPTNWGSGTVTEDTMVTFAGMQSFKIISHGMYQGAKFDLSKPVNLAPYLANKDALMQFTVMVIDNKGTGGTAGRGAGMGGFGAMMGGPGGMPGSNFGNMMSRMMRGRGGPGGMAGAGGSTQTTIQKVKPMENLRVLLITGSGKSAEFLLPMEYAQAESQSTWKSLSIPVAAISGLKAEDAEIKEIRVFSDQPTTLYVGQIRVVVDPTPISVDRISDKLAIPRNRIYNYVCNATAGNVPLKISWDFDERDGIQEDRVGKSIKYAYPKSGEYVATVTVTDAYGIRPPVVRKFKVYISQ